MFLRVERSAQGRPGSTGAAKLLLARFAAAGSVGIRTKDKDRKAFARVLRARLCGDLLEQLEPKNGRPPRQVHENYRAGRDSLEEVHFHGARVRCRNTHQASMEALPHSIAWKATTDDPDTDP